MEPRWTLPELVSEVATRIAALPTPRNGQVRAVPDERTIRYYATLGLLDRPGALRGRTALYGAKHVAQVIAIKRLQTMGRSLSEIQELWSTLDDATLARMSGVALPVATQPIARAAFWKREPRPSSGDAVDRLSPGAAPAAPHRRDATLGGTPALPSARIGSPDPRSAGGPGAVELRIELAPQVVLSLSVVDDRVAVSPADVRAICAAAAPLLAELASRRLASHPEGEEP
jgi:DNA-binding transcriptional MerR regulator